MEQEVLNKIEHLSNTIHTTYNTQVEEWKRKCAECASKPLILRKGILQSILNEINNVLESVESGPLFDTIVKGAYYRTFLNLACSSAINKEDEHKRMVETVETLKYNLRHVVEMMDKEKLFDGFSEEDMNIFKTNCNGSSDTFASYFFDNQLDLVIEQERKPWSKGKISIGLFGKTCAGKTKVLNTIFNENFPVCNGENTAIPTYLYYGKNCDIISLVDAQDKIQHISANDISIIDWDRSSKFPFHRMYDYIAKQNNSEILYDFTFVDAPGVFSGTSSNHITADKCIETTDIIVWVSDLRDSITAKEIEYLNSHSNNKPVYIVATWTNKMSDQEYKCAKEILIQRIRDANINLKSVIRFNTNNLDKFRDTFINIVVIGAMGNSKISPARPLSILQNGINYLVNILEANLSHYINLKIDTENIIDDIRNTRSNQALTFSNRLQATISSLVNTLKTQSSSTFANALHAPLLQLGQDIYRMADAYKDLDIVNLTAQESQYIILLSESEDKIRKIQEIQTNLEELFDKTNDYI